MAAAVTLSQQIVFMTIYTADAVFGGPLLGDLPAFVDAIAKRESLPFVSAINLDGGSASAYSSKNVSLDELTPVGSIFCIKEKSQVQ